MRKLGIGSLIGLIIVLLVIVLMLSQQSPRRVNVISQGNASVRNFIEDFEKGSLDHYEDWVKEFARRDSAVFVSDVARKGQYALKIALRPGDTGNKVSGNRAELVIKNGDSYGSEAWYGWSFLIPKDYQDSDVQDPWQILGQWHHEPNFAKGETWESHGIRPPTISLHYGLLEDGGPAVGIDKYGYGEKKRIVAFKKIEKGKWHDFVIHIRWSLEEDGFVEAWVNNEPFEILKGEKREENKILGPTMFNELPHFFKVGLYRNPLIESVNVIYIDEVRIDKEFLAPL